MSVRRSWRTWLLAAILTPPVLLIACCFGMYAYSASFAPSDIPPSTETAPAWIRQQYLVIETGGASSLPRTNPVAFWIEWIEQVNRFPREPSPDWRLLHRAARLAQSKHGTAKTQGEYHIASLAFNVKVGRQWTFEQAMDTLLAESWYDDGIVGLRQASTHYFGVAPSALRPQESLALIALLKSPRFFDLYCHRERFATRYAYTVEAIGEQGPAWSVDAALTRLRPRECQRP